MSIVLSNVVSRMQLSADVVHGRLRGNINHQPLEGNPDVGSGSGEVQKVYQADVIVEAAYPLTIDVTTAIDPAGNAFNPSKITHILFENNSTGASQNFTLGGGTNALFTAMPLPIKTNGGRMLYEDPDAGITVDATHKGLLITCTSGSASARLTMFGR